MPINMLKKSFESTLERVVNNAQMDPYGISAMDEKLQEMVERTNKL